MPQGRSHFHRKSVEPGLASRTFAPGTRSGIARTAGVRLGPGIAHCPSSRASLDIDHRGNPQPTAITSQLVAAARDPFVFCPRRRLHAFRSPLLRLRARKRARTSCVSPDRDEATARVTVPLEESNATAPQSKPVVQTSRLVALNAPSVALGLGAKSGPQGQLTNHCTPIRGVYVANLKITSDFAARR